MKTSGATKIRHFHTYYEIGEGTNLVLGFWSIFGSLVNDRFMFGTSAYTTRSEHMFNKDLLFGHKLLINASYSIGISMIKTSISIINFYYYY